MTPADPQPDDSMCPEEALELSAAERQRMERETSRIREEDEDMERRVDHVKARVRTLLGPGHGHYGN